MCVFKLQYVVNSLYIVEEVITYVTIQQIKILEQNLRCLEKMSAVLMIEY